MRACSSLFVPLFIVFYKFFLFTLTAGAPEALIVIAVHSLHPHLPVARYARGHNDRSHLLILPHKESSNLRGDSTNFVLGMYHDGPICLFLGKFLRRRAFLRAFITRLNFTGAEMVGPFFIKKGYHPFLQTTNFLHGHLLHDDLARHSKRGSLDASSTPNYLPDYFLGRCPCD